MGKFFFYSSWAWHLKRERIVLLVYDSKSWTSLKMQIPQASHFRSTIAPSVASLSPVFCSWPTAGLFYKQAYLAAWNGPSSQIHIHIYIFFCFGHWEKQDSNWWFSGDGVWVPKGCCPKWPPIQWLTNHTCSLSYTLEVRILRGLQSRCWQRVPFGAPSSLSSFLRLPVWSRSLPASLWPISGLAFLAL